MKDGEKPDFLKDKVALFNVGSNTWKYAPNWESIANQTLKYYLSSPNNNPKEVFQSGVLSDAIVNEKEQDVLIYDPLKSAYKDANLGSDYLTSQSYINEEGWLYYHAPALEEDTEISGFITLNVYIELDTKDTDFYFKLYEVKPDGTNIALGKGTMRARYRNSLKKEELIEPGAINLYAMKSTLMINQTLTKGSRLRLMFGYLDSSGFQKNYNSGKDVSYETSKDAKTATIKLYNSKKYPSSLEIPIQAE